MYELACQNKKASYNTVLSLYISLDRFVTLTRRTNIHACPTLAQAQSLTSPLTSKSIEIWQQC
jgi:hypothetical protein